MYLVGKDTIPSTHMFYFTFLLAPSLPPSKALPSFPWSETAKSVSQGNVRNHSVASFVPLVGIQSNQRVGQNVKDAEGSACPVGWLFNFYT